MIISFAHIKFFLKNPISVKMKKSQFIVLFIFLTGIRVSAQTYEVTSPDNTIKAVVEIGENINYSIMKGDHTIIAPSRIDMEINEGDKLGVNAKVKKVSRATVSETIKPVVRQKFSEIDNAYNELLIRFKGNYALNFRLFDDGVAYRWETAIKDDMTVNNETATFNFARDYAIWFPEEESIYTHQERAYPKIKLSAITEDRFCSTPTLVDLGAYGKVLLTEADLMDYPGMFLMGHGQHGLRGKYAGVALETKQTSDRDVKVTKYADYLAKTDGKRTFPWRVMIIAANDGELLTSEMVYKLSRPLALEDASWIKPGKVAWDWWNANNVYNVDFRAGINNDTYKYYIDFASANNIPYIILDEGWYHLEDVLQQQPDIDIEELVAYGEAKDVSLILWVTWKALEDKMEEALQQFEDWGVKGIKVDFMQRDDQWMVNYYQRVAELAARHQLLVDFHGSYKPTGLRRPYPNVITREGVKGLEQSKWSEDANPEHNVTIPFIRMVAGPMDYTPGAMINATKENFSPVFNKPMSMGTRCHQLAMYVVFESPLQMLADNPTHYYEEPECMQFLRAVPTEWDDTQVLEAKVSDYVVMARRSGDTWYLGAMTDWEERSFSIDLDFLEKGAYEMEIWQDGINADRYAEDFEQQTKEVTANTKIDLSLAPGGGWVAVIRQK